MSLDENKKSYQIMTKLIKSLLLLAVAISALTLVSCSEDDDDGPSGVSGTLVGSWESASVTIDEITVNGQDLVAYLQGIGFPQELIDFFEAGLAEGTEESFAIDLEFRADGTYTATDETGSENGTWELTNGDTVILFDKGTENEFEMTIVSLTDTRFEGSVMDVDNSEDIDEDGTNDELSISLTLVLTKS